MGPHEMPSVGAMVSVCDVRSRHVGTSEVTGTKRLTNSGADGSSALKNWTKDESAELLAGLEATIARAFTPRGSHARC
jgi:hypothetical protein